MKKLGVHEIKSLLILFWAAWFTTVTLSNFFDLLMHVGVLSGDWEFVSNNYALVSDIMRTYPVTAKMAGFTFGVVVVLEFFISVTFWRALFAFLRHAEDMMVRVNVPFFLSLLMWSGFLLMQELLVSYRFEVVHFSMMAAQLLTFLVIHQLQEPEPVAS